MRVHIDGIIFSLQSYGGITVYFRELLRRFKPEHNLSLTLEERLQQQVRPLDFPAVRCIRRPARALERVRRCRPLDNAVPTVYHSSYYRRPARTTDPVVVTVHDFVYERMVHGPRRLMHRWLMNGAIGNAQHIICISEATRDDLMEFVPIRADQTVSVIHNGVSDVFRPLAATQTISPARPFVLFVGQRDGYKNFGLALRALEHMPEIEMHCVGGGTLQPAELADTPDAVRSRVRHLGFVDDEQLNTLYNRAQCLLYPSSYEGFGIPVLEAMRAGCPVVSIDCKAVLEVGGDALMVSKDPKDPFALAQAVRQTADAGLRRQLGALGLKRSRQFSWDRCFEETLGVYRSLQP